MTNTEPLNLEAIEARAANATAGPWKVWAMDVLSDRAGTNDVSDAAFVASTADPDRGLRTFNADFIAAAREDVPALIAEVRRLREEVPRQVSTREEFDALPVLTVIRSAAGTIAARWDSDRGIVLGDERTFPWALIALPATILYAVPTHEESR